MTSVQLEGVCYWVGSRDCDICHRPIDKYLYDAPHYTGPWAVMCEECYPSEAKYPEKLGTGLGQKYERQKDGRFIKVEG